jgi:hypothetical protein
MPAARAATRPGARRRRVAGAIVVALALWLPACRFIISSGPTTVSSATIIFVVVDDGDRLVGSTHITVREVAGDWTASGVTAAGGQYQCRVRAGVSQVSVWVEPPDGFALADGNWPRRLDVSRPDPLEIRIRVRRLH